MKSEKSKLLTIRMAGKGDFSLFTLHFWLLPSCYFLLLTGLMEQPEQRLELFHVMKSSPKMTA